MKDHNVLGTGNPTQREGSGHDMVKQPSLKSGVSKLHCVFDQLTDVKTSLGGIEDAVGGSRSGSSAEEPEEAVPYGLVNELHSIANNLSSQIEEITRIKASIWDAIGEES